MEQTPGRQVNEEIRRILAEEREAQGLSINQLAERAGVDRVSLGRFESVGRNPAFWYLYDVAEALGLNFAEVVAQAQKKVVRRKKR